ncbi:DUF397 domain-containing protein [Actinomadura rudentiformis]|uniref:DUF397 domain-containing protein n=1 Tax=Actinomadura rudentiformis TaxID=359158 RepID=A0A6H9Z245_9ACTN|nr:DUF397 domain-containing protein [Actinomadura rudentiformis]KAB2348336.1 DUF397 domain-containing protein [Actinomadura rudentiformis]
MRSGEGSGAWRKACGESAACVETASLNSGMVGVRDSMDPGNHLEISADRWQLLRERIKKGECDLQP